MPLEDRLVMEFILGQAGRELPTTKEQVLSALMRGIAQYLGTESKAIYQKKGNISKFHETVENESKELSMKLGADVGPAIRSLTRFGVNETCRFYSLFKGNKNSFCNVYGLTKFEVPKKIRTKIITSWPNLSPRAQKEIYGIAHAMSRYIDHDIEQLQYALGD